MQLPILTGSSLPQTDITSAALIDSLNQMQFRYCAFSAHHNDITSTGRVCTDAIRSTNLCCAHNFNVRLRSLCDALLNDRKISVDSYESALATIEDVRRNLQDLDGIARLVFMVREGEYLPEQVTYSIAPLGFLNPCEVTERDIQARLRQMQEACSEPLRILIDKLRTCIISTETSVF